MRKGLLARTTHSSSSSSSFLSFFFSSPTKVPTHSGNKLENTHCPYILCCRLAKLGTLLLSTRLFIDPTHSKKALEILEREAKLNTRKSSYLNQENSRLAGDSGSKFSGSSQQRSNSKVYFNLYNHTGQQRSSDETSLQLVNTKLATEESSSNNWKEDEEELAPHEI